MARQKLQTEASNRSFNRSFNRTYVEHRVPLSQPDLGEAASTNDPTRSSILLATIGADAVENGPTCAEHW